MDGNESSSQSHRNQSFSLNDHNSHHQTPDAYVLCDDIVHYVMQFMESYFIVQSCMRVSKQWFKIALSIPLSLRLNFQKLQNAAKCANLTNLTSLDLNNFVCEELNGEEILTSGCLALANSPYLQNLTHLNLSINTQLKRDHIKILATSSNMCKLSTLCIFLTYIGDEGMRAITEMKSLTSLKFGNNSISLEGVKHVTTMSKLTELEVLHLDLNVVKTHQCLNVIANSEKMNNLTKLTLYKSGITAEQVRSLTTSHHMKQLTYLELRGNNIRDSGIISIAKSEFMKNLTHLNVSTCMISDTGAISLTLSSFMSQLRILNLSNEEGPSRQSEINTVGNEFIQALSKSECMQNLEELNLLDTKVNDLGAVSLSQSKILKRLKCLHLSEIGPETSHLILTSFPKIKFENLPRTAFDECLLM
nr:unnamed protein product [Naegleria fowleri]